jgi:hypothetical protein
VPPLPLSLPETLLLLGFDAKTGAARYGLDLSYALAGAQLHELALAGRIIVQAEHVTVVDATATGDPQLDELLAKIASTSDDPRKPGHWVMKRKSKAVPLYLRRLVHCGVLSSRRTRILGLVPRTIFPIVDEQSHAQAREGIDAALAGQQPPPDRAAALIALVSVTGLSPELGHDRAQQERAAQIAEDDVVACAVKRAVDAVRVGA